MPRRPRGGLAAWLRDAETPLYVVDGRRVVLFFNRGCEEMTGWSAAEIVGGVCDYASEADGSLREATLCALCPPPPALEGAPLSVPVEIPSRDGGMHLRNATFTPLVSGESQDLHILCALLPRQAEQPAPAAPPIPTELHAALARLRHSVQQEFGSDQVIARSPAMIRVLRQVELAAKSTSGACLQGEPGTGREFLARVIHGQSPRRQRPFVPLDCRVLTPFELKRTLQRVLHPDDRGEPPPELLPGGILLRNVAHMPRDVQQWLVESFADCADRGSSDCVLFASDVVRLEEAVDDDRLFPELYFRLTALTIEVPPLRERMEDVPLLAQNFLERLNRRRERQCGGFVPETLELLQNYNWPGNVRELRLVVEEADAAAAGPWLLPGDLPLRFRAGMDAQRTPPRKVVQPIDLEAILREVESREIRRALAESRQNRAQAARLLGLTRARLYRRMQQLGLDAANEPAE